MGRLEDVPLLASLLEAPLPQFPPSTTGEDIQLLLAPVWQLRHRPATVQAHPLLPAVATASSVVSHDYPSPLLLILSAFVPSTVTPCS